jgi:hypothetical protein
VQKGLGSVTRRKYVSSQRSEPSWRKGSARMMPGLRREDIAKKNEEAARRKQGDRKGERRTGEEAMEAENREMRAGASAGG